MLVEGIVRRSGFMLLSGGVGTGKTTLLHSLFLILSRKLKGDQKLSSAFIVNPTLSREEFMEFILQELDIPCTHTTKPRRLLALHQSLIETHRQGSTTVLVIDEAHLLSREVLEEIRLLGNLDSYGDKLMQIVLCGQPELLHTLMTPDVRALNQRIAVRTSLRALSATETRSYIAERLHVAGLRDASPFSAPVIEQIHFYSGGVPRLINLLCDTCLALGYKTDRQAIGKDMVFEAAAMLDLDPDASFPPQVTPLVDSAAAPQRPRAVS